MIDQKRKEEIRARLVKHNDVLVFGREMNVNAVEISMAEDFSADIRDLLSAHKELEADNAAMLGFVPCLCLPSFHGNDKPHPDCIQHSHEHPGTALLARHQEELDAEKAARFEKHDFLNLVRYKLGLPEVADPPPDGYEIMGALSRLHQAHAEELAKKDREIAEQKERGDIWLKAAQDAASEIVTLCSDLNRAREALRSRPIGGVTFMRYGASNMGYLCCGVCDGQSDLAEFGKGSERHNPVTINGITGPCPAEKKGREG